MEGITLLCAIVRSSFQPPKSMSMVPTYSEKVIDHARICQRVSKGGCLTFLYIHKYTDYAKRKWLSL